MGKHNKYNAIGLWYDPIADKAHKSKKRGSFFIASHLELSIYRALVSIYGSDRVIRQDKVPLIPRTKRNKAIAWNVDFAVIGLDPKRFAGGKVWIEAKGFETEAFQIKYQLFKYLYPNRLIIVAHSIKELLSCLTINSLHSGLTDVNNIKDSKTTYRSSQLSFFELIQ